MGNSLRFGTALSVIAVATLVGGCAGPMERAGRSSLGKANFENIALGSRAQAALDRQDYASAIDLAERAVLQSPSNAMMRTLLGNAYFASGRFTSAEGAYRDSLGLSENQPQVALKLALVQIAQGRSGDAINFLSAARGSLNASDYGLALALAGQTYEAVAILDAAARETNADSQVRQNLALAHALAGDWTAARTVAAQDLTADLVEQRIQQWMALAQPKSAADQVAALVGITPAVADPGQPVQLALRAGDTRTAAAEAAPLSNVATVQLPPVVEAAPAAVEVAEVEALAPLPAVSAPDAPITIQTASAPAPAPAFDSPLPPVLRAAKPIPVRKAAITRDGSSAAVVQLGAFGSADGVGRAWNTYARKFSALKDYTPVSARFASSKGTVYRLSVKGFDNLREAQGLCSSLRRSGGSCFVRSVAGDAPVRIASR